MSNNSQGDNGLNDRKRVVVTGLGLVTPIGIGQNPFWENLSSGNSGIAENDLLEWTALPDNVAGQVKDFTDSTAKKDYLKAQRKSIKVMCREIQLGVASASQAIENAGLDLENMNHARFGVEFGANLMLSPPEVLAAAAGACTENGDGKFRYDHWGDLGLRAMEPLWLLKYLPNMPACHIGIYAQACGPSNSLTLAEASGNSAIGEAFRIIARGHADVMVAGTTGTQLHAVKSMHAVMWDQLATSPADPARRSRPFERNRTGQVAAEGACTFILEDEATAKSRGARILGSILGAGSSCVIDRQGVPNIRQALINAMRSALRDAGLQPADVGHINAHGLASVEADRIEAQAILDVFGDYGREVPVTAIKSYVGNSGAGCGTIELAGSLLALQHGIVVPTLNYDEPDPECPLNVVHGEPLAVSNRVVLKTSFTRMGQASVLIASGA